MTDERPLSQKEFDEIFNKVARLTVELIIKTDAGVVLTLRSIEPCKGEWHIPGGTVRHGETLVEAVERVAEDELGVEVEVQEQIGYIEYPTLKDYGYRGWPVGIAFECRVKSGELRGSEQGEAVECFKQLPENIFPSQEAFLSKYLDNNSF